jgi:enolase
MDGAVNILSGGKDIANTLDFYKFMIVPIGQLSGVDSLQMCTEVYHTVEQVLTKLGRNTSTGEDGGFTPNLVSNEEALAVILGAVQKAGYKPGEQIALAVDVAASNYFENGKYNFPGEGFVRTPNEMVEYYVSLVEEYPLLSIQGGMARDDRQGWELFVQRLGDKIHIGC